MMEKDRLIEDLNKTKKMKSYLYLPASAAASCASKIASSASASSSWTSRAYASPWLLRLLSFSSLHALHPRYPSGENGKSKRFFFVPPCSSVLHVPLEFSPYLSFYYLFFLKKTLLYMWLTFITLILTLKLTLVQPAVSFFKITWPMVNFRVKDQC